MVRKLSVCVAVAGVVSMLLAGSAVAQEKKKADAPKKPDATVKISEGSVAVGIGWTWGKGELTYKGKKYPVKVDGLSVGEVGVTKAEATGNVFNLKKLEDFDGIYASASAEGTAVKGAGVVALRNGAGVVLELKSVTKGANIKLAVEGLKLAVEKK